MYLNESVPLDLNKVLISDNFWAQYVKLVREVVIPYQWEALNNRVPEAEPSFAVRNLRIAAGLEQGEFKGLVFQDSDLAKWLEAVGYCLQTQPDPHLESIMDETIDLIGKAQLEDGYFNTYFTVAQRGKRWTNLWECHELYCAGHMIEASVAYYHATGKRKFLDICCRYADHIDSVFGYEEGKLKGYDGHQEIELALVKLYEATGCERYLKLARFFIDERGAEPYFFDAEWEKRGRLSYWHKGVCSAPGNDRKHTQTHLPVRDQSVAVGHSVRAVYMYSAMADIAARTGDPGLLDVCRRLWDNVISKQMYITGGIGSTRHGEAFTFDYDLPSHTAYSETCAAIGLIFFAQRMLLIEPKSQYADVIEKALYNTVAGAMSKDGRHFFYVNPLEVWPQASAKSPDREHVKAVRQKWFGCACCPPNVARLLASLGHYIYTADENTLYVHLYIGGEAQFRMAGESFGLSQQTRYPWDGDITLRLSASVSKAFNLALRIPGWCRKAALSLNDRMVDIGQYMKDGYVVFHNEWKDGDMIKLSLEMPVERMQSNPEVRANAGRVAIQRGPLVYCLEEADNGPNLHALALPADAKLTETYNRELLGGMVAIGGEALRDSVGAWGYDLYKPYEKAYEKATLKAVPYFAWGNRKEGEMLVWIRSV